MNKLYLSAILVALIAGLQHLINQETGVNRQTKPD